MVQYDFVYNRKGRINKNGKALVQIRCYYEKKYKFLSTEIRVKPEHWDSDKGEVHKKYPRAGVLNRHIREQVQKLEDFEIDLISKGKKFNFGMLEPVLNGPSSTITFNQFVKNELEISSIRESSKKQQKVFMNKLNEFNSKTQFDEINLEFLQRFEKFLYSKGLNTNSVGKEFKNFRKFVNLAIDKEMIPLDKYPFRKFKIKTKPTNKVHLTEDEVNRIKNLELEVNSEIEFIRDLYLVGIYTGLRFSDIVNLRNEDIKKIEGETLIEKRMQKTENFIRIPISKLFEGKAKTIINKYVDEKNTHVFQSYSNQHVNRILKVIGHMANIQKKIAFHSSRHTFATLLLNKGLRIEIVSKLMGHSNIQQTQEYANLLNITVDKALAELYAKA